MRLVKSIQRVTDPRRQQVETYRYWQSLPVGDRLSAVCEISIDAYAFKGTLYDDATRPERTITRVQRARR